jgi:hypothetical protein
MVADEPNPAVIKAQLFFGTVTVPFHVLQLEDAEKKI